MLFEVSEKCVMSAKLHCSIFTGCVASVVLESVWTAIDCAGTGPGRVSLATGISWPHYQKVYFFCSSSTEISQ